MDITVLTDLFDKYPNFYFDLSGTTNPHMQDKRPDLLDHYTENLHAHVDAAFSQLGSTLEAYPDRFLWGWDSGSEGMDFNEDFFALSVEFTRKLLGLLTPTTAQKIAFSNAHRLFCKTTKAKGSGPCR
jgi:hypothetical protein